MQVIPAIDVLGEQAVRLHQGDYEAQTGFGDPIVLARRLSAYPWVHVVDLDGARSGRVRPELVAQIEKAASPARIQASGGIRTLEDAEALFAAGATRVVLGTAAWTLLHELDERFVVALDVRDGIVRTAGWTEAGLALDEALARCVEARVARVLCTAIDRDGTLTGPDLELVARVAASCIPTLAAGGIRNEDDVDALARAGAEGAIVGRALLEGALRLRQEPR